jgi:hypothetical protein
MHELGRTYEAHGHLVRGEALHGGLGASSRIADYRALEFGLAWGEFYLTTGELAKGEEVLLRAYDEYGRLKAYSQQTATLAVLAQVYASQSGRGRNLDDCLQRARTAARLAEEDAASANTLPVSGRAWRGEYQFRWVPNAHDDRVLADRHLARIELVVGQQRLASGEHALAGEVFRDAADHSRRFPDELRGTLRAIIDAMPGLNDDAIRAALSPVVRGFPAADQSEARSWAQQLLNEIRQRLHDAGTAPI